MEVSIKKDFQHLPNTSCSYLRRVEYNCNINHCVRFTEIFLAKMAPLLCLQEKLDQLPYSNFYGTYCNTEVDFKCLNWIYIIN